MERKFLKLLLFNMAVLSSNKFMKNYNLKDYTMDESDLKKAHNYSIYLRDSEITTKKLFVNIDQRSMGGSHWVCFYKKDDDSIYCDSFEVFSDKILPKQLSKSIISQNHKNQDINSNLCGEYCLYFFYLIETMNFFDAVTKVYFGQVKMPIYVFGNRSFSNDSDNIFDASLYIQKTIHKKQLRRK